MFDEDYVDYLEPWEIETDDEERYFREHKKKQEEKQEELRLKRKMSDVEGEESEPEDEQGEDELDFSGPKGKVGVAAKLQEWGMNEKDWTKPTELHVWLGKKPDWREYIVDLIDQVTNGTISLLSLEDKLPPHTTTNFYWKTKAQFERLRSKTVFNIVGFCPQYTVLLDDEPHLVEPEKSSCATTLILSWFARQIDVPTVSWDFRMDCRKAKVAEKSGYRHCHIMTPKEVQELHGLNNLLLQIAKRYFDITVVGALSFHAESNRFTNIYMADNVPVIRLYTHLSQLHRILPILISELLSKGFSKLSYQQLWDGAAAHFRRAPGREQGRRRYLLPVGMQAYSLDALMRGNKEDDLTSVAKRAQLREKENPNRRRLIRWTKAEHATLVDMTSTGYGFTFRRIAEKLGRSITSVQGHYRDHLDPKGPMKPFGGWIKEYKS